MVIPDNYVAAIEALPRRDKAALLCAAADYVYADEEPQGLSKAAQALWVALRFELDKSNTKSKAGRKGGKASGRVRAQKGNAEQMVASEAENEARFNPASEAGGEALTEQNETEQTKTEHEHNNAGRACDGQGAEDDASAFVARALETWNSVTDSKLRHLPQAAAAGMRQAHRDGRTLEDVRRVIMAAHSNWEPQNVTPNALLGDRFEEWLANPPTQRAAGNERPTTLLGCGAGNDGGEGWLPR